MGRLVAFALLLAVAAAADTSARAATRRASIAGMARLCTVYSIFATPKRNHCSRLLLQRAAIAAGCYCCGRLVQQLAAAAAAAGCSVMDMMAHAIGPITSTP